MLLESPSDSFVFVCCRNVFTYLPTAHIEDTGRRIGSFFVWWTTRRTLQLNDVRRAMSEHKPTRRMDRRLSSCVLVLIIAPYVPSAVRLLCKYNTRLWAYILLSRLRRRREPVLAVSQRGYRRPLNVVVVVVVVHSRPCLVSSTCERRDLAVIIHCSEISVDSSSERCRVDYFCCWSGLSLWWHRFRLFFSTSLKVCVI